VAAAPRSTRAPAARRGERPVDLFEAATRLDALEAAWVKVRGNGGCAGSDGVTLERFALGAPGRLVALQRALREGRYAPEPLRLFEVPKPDGGVRPLAVPVVADRIAQTALAQALGPLVEPELSEASFAYRPGRSVQQAVHAICRYRDAGFTWVVEGDIERCFERIPHAPLLDRLERLLAERPGAEAVTALVALWLEGFGHDLGTPGTGLAQGSPLSPLLANLYLDVVDEALEAEGAGVRLVRYADDLVLLARSEAGAGAALERLAALLAAHALALNPEKSRVVSFDRGFRFLGHLFVRSMVLKAAFKEGPEEAPAAEGIDELLRWVAARDAEEAEAEARAAAERTAGLVPALRVLYLRQPGRTLAVRNQAFAVVEAGRELLAVPAQRVDRIEIGPEVRVEDAALRLAMVTDTLVHWVDGHGATLATFAPPALAKAGLHEDQARTVLDPERRTELARILVEGRIRNQRVLLHRLKRGRGLERLADPLARMGRIVRKLAVAADVPALLGHEGEAAALFWPALAALVVPSWAVADRRRFRRDRHPAPDPFNVVLNYLAWLLARDLGALVARHGLHPGFGALHTAQDDQEAVVYDLMEEFRAPLVEGLAVYLFNNRILGEALFVATGERGCRMGRAGHGPLIRTFEAWLDRPVVSPRTGERTLWRGLLEDQVRGYAEHCRGLAAYRPYRMDH
jgi:CRISPR-associated protein Cas1